MPGPVPADERVTLYLVFLSPLEAEARGLFHPPGRTEPEPENADLVAWEAELDAWNGDDAISASPPWFLATASLCEAFEEARLTGLRVGATAFLDYSETGKILAPRGALASKEVPVFRIVVPDHAIEVHAVRHSDDDVLREGDDLRYSGWRGHDFSRSDWGPVITERSLTIFRAHHSAGMYFWPVTPADE
jgi:hypothetical protein